MGIVGKIIGAIMTGTGMVLLTLGMDPNIGVLSWGYFIIGLFMMSLGMALITGGKSQQVKKPKPPTITEIRCDNSECTFKELRDFERGDYILKPLDVPCPRCGGTMTIQGIYIIRDESEEKIKI